MLSIVDNNELQQIRLRQGGTAVFEIVEVALVGCWSRVDVCCSPAAACLCYDFVSRFRWMLLPEVLAVDCCVTVPVLYLVRNIRQKLQSLMMSVPK
jgi:hypothetical protein